MQMKERLREAEFRRSRSRSGSHSPPKIQEAGIEERGRERKRRGSDRSGSSSSRGEERDRQMRIEKAEEEARRRREEIRRDRRREIVRDDRMERAGIKKSKLERD